MFWYVFDNLTNYAKIYLYITNLQQQICLGRNVMLTK